MRARRTHHVVDGDVAGPPILLLNGLGTSLDMWDGLVPALTERYTVVRLDFPGHGRSPATPGPYTMDGLAAEALAVLDDLGVARAHVVGCSLGGMVAQRLALNAPHRVESLVLISTAAKLGSPQFWQERAQLARAQGTAGIAGVVVPRWFTTRFQDSQPHVVRAAVDMLAHCDAGAYASSCVAIGGHDARQELDRIGVPALVLAGDEDPALPDGIASELAAGIPGARYERIAGTAHLLTIEDPETAGRLILNHLSTSRETDMSSHPEMTPSEPEPSHAYSAGMQVRREVLGDSHVDRAREHASTFSMAFQEFITEHAWGSTWARPGLSRKMRSALTLALLTALHNDHEIAMHVRAAVQHGLSPDEIKEILLHTAVYAGVPVANHGFGIADATLREMGLVEE